MLKRKCPLGESLRSFARRLLSQPALVADGETARNLRGAAQQWAAKKRLETPT